MKGGVQLSGIERRKGVTVRGGREVGHGLLPGPGWIWSRGPFSLFLIFFLFPFLFYLKIGFETSTKHSDLKSSQFCNF
jgi:hypothetical protein